MEKKIITFSANEQQLIKTGGINCYASNIVAYIEAQFDLGANWQGFDSVRAVWYTGYVKGISTVLDSNGKCIVPFEVLTHTGEVMVNLVGSISDGETLTDRLTTCPVTAVAIKCNARIDGDNAKSITPSEYEQFVANVKADADRAEAGADEAEASAQSASESATASADSATSSAQSATASAQSAQNASESAISAENAKDDAEDARDKILGMRATAETLEAGSDATASYSDGLLTLGIPRGDKGEQGIQGEMGATPNFSIGEVDTLEPNESATATITGTAENPVLNLGIPKGEQGDVSLEQLEALLPTETASGEIVTITDGQSVVPAKSLKVALDPIQEGSGTPSPDNIRPISGHTEVNTQRTGKNLLAKPFSFRNNNATIADAFPIREGTYTFSFSSIGTATRWRFGVSLFDKDGNALNANEYAPNANMSFVSSINMWWFGADVTLKSLAINVVEDAYIRIWFAGGNTTSEMESVDAQLELGSTETDYEPYQGNTYTTSLGQTVYGGTLDVVSGELVVDRAMADLGTLAWNYNTLWASFGVFTRDLSEAKTFVADSKLNCSDYSQTATNSSSNVETVALMSDGQIQIKQNSKQIYIRDSRYTDPTAFKSAMSGVQLCYELATPQTIQLTPQEVELLTGTNNVWADGNVTLVYSADIQKWVEKQLS